MNALEQNMDLIDDHLVEYRSLLPLYYHFEYLGIKFECQIIEHDTPDQYYVNLTANIGYLPYSSENKKKRELILKNFSRLMVKKLITINHHCEMKFPVSTIIKGEISAKIVMETIFYTLLDAKEILEIIVKSMQEKHIDSSKQ